MVIQRATSIIASVGVSATERSNRENFFARHEPASRRHHDALMLVAAAAGLHTGLVGLPRIQ
jgi:hypothetical protein